MSIVIFYLFTSGCVSIVTNKVFRFSPHMNLKKSYQVKKAINIRQNGNKHHSELMIDYPN